MCDNGKTSEENEVDAIKNEKGDIRYLSACYHYSFHFTLFLVQYNPLSLSSCVTDAFSKGLKECTAAQRFIEYQFPYEEIERGKASLPLCAFIGLFLSTLYPAHTLRT